MRTIEQKTENWKTVYQILVPHAYPPGGALALKVDRDDRRKIWKITLPEGRKSKITLLEGVV